MRTAVHGAVLALLAGNLMAVGGAASPAHAHDCLGYTDTGDCIPHVHTTGNDEGQQIELEDTQPGTPPEQGSPQPDDPPAGPGPGPGPGSDPNPDEPGPGLGAGACLGAEMGALLGGALGAAVGGATGGGLGAAVGAGLGAAAGAAGAEGADACLGDTAAPAELAEVTPAQAAVSVVAKLDIEAIDIGITPDPDDPSKIGLVGMPVWMWVEDPSPRTWGPTSASASAGGLQVSLDAHVDDVTWDMGNGDTVVCEGPGTPYEPRHGKDPSPDCGYRYTESSGDQPNQAFTVTATSNWVVNWQAGGQSGTLSVPVSRSADIRVGEMQVLSTH